MIYANEQVSVFNLAIINIRNFIPNEIITYDSQDPPRMNSIIKNLIGLKIMSIKNF